MEQVSTARIQDKIAELESEVVDLRERERQMARSGSFRETGQAEYFAAAARNHTIGVLKELLDASNKEAPSTEGQGEPQAPSFSDVLESLRGYLREEAAVSRARERALTPLQQEHVDRIRAYRTRLAEAAEAYFKEQAPSDQAKSKG